MKAIIVEDSPQFQDLIRVALEFIGISDVSVATDGGKALEILQSGGANVMIMDWMMEGMDGMECTRQIRSGAAGSQYSNIPIILLTGNSDQKSEALAAEAGASHFMTKPFSVKQLKTALIKILKPS